ncbi:hypothetical protein [Faecalicatena contorta]|uniref:Uncharacterized protein n=1 Tax=Faecalicatena contorta TaxID=39482 RepID=A0A315ZT45_9FIRM|nr:hypothetical protein [Faecalicatena contorta]PWJ48100.1 hypothetical protein A8805_11476 [Faecalicatena contorta]SUQ15627.1 hypothetical protein SAMN05216529_11476 [Faecalicatena contorta]
MTRHDKIEVDNSGTNKGVVVGTNEGIINLTLNETKKIPSLISTIIKNLGTECADFDIPETELDFDPFKPDEKLEYNCVIKYKEIIKEYSVYYTLCDNRLNVYDNSNSRSKKKILRCIKTWYLTEKGEVLLKLKSEKATDIEKVRANADKLIDSVKERIKEAVMNSDVQEISVEDLELGIACFVCYSFMECKILEKPV